MNELDTPELLCILHNSVKKMDQRCWEAVKDDGFTKNEVIVLLFLSNQFPRDTASDIIRFRGISKAHASKSIDSLIQKGYLTSHFDEADRRIMHLRIASAAAPVVERINKERNLFFAGIMQGLSAQQQESLKNIAKKIRSNSESL